MVWDLRRIYTTIILGTTLLNFDSRGQYFWARSAWFTRQNMFVFFNVDFWNGTPETRTAHLNLWVPALIWQRFTYDFRRASGEVSRAVQKENSRISSSKGNCMACCFEKAKTSVTIEGRSKVIPCTALICTKAAIIRPAASYSGLSKSSTLKRGMNASPFFCVVWHGGSILSWWTVVFQL